MAEILFNKSILLTFFFLIQIEFFIYLCYNNVILLTRLTKIFHLNQVLNNFSVININSVYLYLTIFVLSFFKTNFSYIDFIILICLLFLFLLNYFLEKVSYKSNISNTIYIIIPTILYFIFFLTCSSSFLVLFFLIELYGVLYYFCFLTTYNFTRKTILKYKNGLLLLLWNNFLTTILLVLSCFFLLRNYGTTSFNELSFLQIYNPYIYLFLIGFFWKLGLPLFHFFKLEVYRFLLKENVFLFSIITALINFLLFFVIFSNNVVFSVIYSVNLLLLIIFFSCFLILTNLKLVNFLQFFAFSGIFTLTTVSTVFLL